MFVQDLETGALRNVSTPPARMHSNLDPIRDAEFVTTADLTGLYTSTTAAPRAVGVPVAYVRPVRPAHVGIHPTAALKAAAIVVGGFLLFLVAVYFIAKGISPR